MLCAREDLVDSLELLQFMRRDSGHKEVRFSVLLPGTGELKPACFGIIVTLES